MFFSIFLVSSVVIPHPLFPGSVVFLLFGFSGLGFVLGCGVVNGLFYGFVVWVVFRLGFRWVEGLGGENKKR